MTTQFPLNSDECELLLLLESHASLQSVAEALGRDHSVVARSLKKMADRFPVVEKKAGKWVLTVMGREFNKGTRSAIQVQTAALNTRQTLRIGTNREFASRILGADFINFQKLFPSMELNINSYQEGVEASLLAGHIDIGIDCDRPQDPDIAFKLVADEPIVAVASASFKKAYKKKGAVDLFTAPHLYCERLNPDKILARTESRTSIIARFNDIAATRAVCVQGAGWAFLPYYAVREELDKGQLFLLSNEVFGTSKYGVWWLRARPYLKEFSEKIGAWTGRQDLSLPAR